MEIALADNAKVDRANAEFAKLQRAEDGRKAMSEYEAERAATVAKTERLRALRLAREASLAGAEPAPAVEEPAPKTKAETLASWRRKRTPRARKA